MTPELTMLLYSVVLFFVIIMVPASEAILKNGAMAQAGPRDNLPEPTVFNKRARRLSANMLEHLVLFAAVVLLAHAAGTSNENTMLGAQVFFWARVVHAVIYLAGWPMIRPLAWFISVVGIGMVAWPLF